MIKEGSDNTENLELRRKRLSKDYFDIQLAFAKVVNEKTGISLDKVLFTHTNFFRQFGLGNVSSMDESNPSWQEYIKGVTSLQHQNEITDYTYEFYLRSPEGKKRPKLIFGCFNCDPINEQDGVVYLHFYNVDKDGTSPLSANKIEKRKSELRDMFSYIKHMYPGAKIVRGGSWLHSLEAYRRLFPPAYNDSRRPVTADRFQGTSYWGQFLKHDGQIRDNLREEFLDRLQEIDPSHIADAFPMRKFRTEAPIEDFYSFYGVDA